MLSKCVCELLLIWSGVCVCGDVASPCCLCWIWWVTRVWRWTELHSSTVPTFTSSLILLSPQAKLCQPLLKASEPETPEKRPPGVCEITLTLNYPIKMTQKRFISSYSWICIFRWVADHFVKTWCERNFSLLSPELHRACLTAVTDNMVSSSLAESCCIHLIAQMLSTHSPVFNSTGRKVKHYLIKDALY